MTGNGERISIGSCDSPLGTVWIASSAKGICVMTVPGATREEFLREVTRRCTAEPALLDGGPIVEQAIRELRAYFDGERTEFRVPLDLRGTPFQQRVWKTVYQLGYGEIVTYREIAERVGAPNAFRAVGAANGANPAAIIVPCHRVVGSDGKLHGYGGGLHQKQWLLEMERRYRNGDGCAHAVQN